MHLLDEIESRTGPYCLLIIIEPNSQRKKEIPSDFEWAILRFHSGVNFLQFETVSSTPTILVASIGRCTLLCVVGT
jgi:hypothetical protein